MDNLHCDERQRLTDEWSQAVAVFSAAVDELHNSMGRVPLADYKPLHAATEQARQLTKLARVALDLHRQAHGC